MELFHWQHAAEGSQKLANNPVVHWVNGVHMKEMACTVINRMAVGRRGSCSAQGLFFQFCQLPVNRAQFLLYVLSK